MQQPFTRRRLRRAALIFAAALTMACRADVTMYTASNVRVVTFGDSNTDMGIRRTGPTPSIYSYIGADEPRMSPSKGNSPLQLAGKIEAHWSLLGRMERLSAVNHGVGGTTTGGGGHGGPDRHPMSKGPEARTVVDGITRFEAEVLGLGYPWSGGETHPLIRSKAFRPGPDDFAYIALGTNDVREGISPAQTLENFEWMIDRWVAEGLRTDHLFLATLPPQTGYADGVLAVNAGLRDLAAARGVQLVDISAMTSADGGRTWRMPSLHIGDGVHYAESVRDGIAAVIVARIAATLNPQP